MPESLQLITPARPEDVDAYYDLRWRILREPWKQPRGSERDELDSGADHVAALMGTDHIIGAGRVHLVDPKTAQIRYMAVEPDFRGIGVGQSILKRLEKIAAARGVTRIIVNAREKALGFYERNGYSIQGHGPTLYGEIPHYRMEKPLG